MTTTESETKAEAAPPARGRRARSLLVNLGLSAIAFGLLGLAIWSNREEIRGVFARKIDSRLMGLALVVYLGGILLTFVRWFVLFRALDVPLSLRDAIRLGFIGNVFNLVIPGAVGGDVVKAGFVYKKVPPASRAPGIASMVIDRLVGLLGLFALAAAMGAIAWGRSNPEVHKLTAIAGAATLAGVVGLWILFTPALYRPLRGLVRGRETLESLFDKLVATAAIYRSRTRVVVATILMSTINHSMNVLSFFLVGRALFGQVPSLADHFVIVPLVLFTTAVPLPFGALGLTEQVSGQLFELVQHPGGAVAMMGFRVIMDVGALAGILVYLANLREVREAKAEAAKAHLDEL